MATVTFSAADDVLYAYLAGEIDHDAAQNLRIQLDDALLNRTPRTLVLDFGGVGFMDSSGIGLILGRQRCARSIGRDPADPARARSSCGGCFSWRISPACPAGEYRRNEYESRKQYEDPVRLPQRQ